MHHRSPDAVPVRHRDFIARWTAEGTFMFDLRNFNAAIGTLLRACVPLAAFAQNWKPERPVELIVGCAPGCGPDNMSRLMQRVPGSSAMHIESDGKESRASARHLAVHANAGNQWRLIARQSTRQPEA